MEHKIYCLYFKEFVSYKCKRCYVRCKNSGIKNELNFAKHETDRSDSADDVRKDKG